ncbi:MAG: AMP-binding enzyme, partial [Ilumatobacteraceae bacterium]
SDGSDPATLADDIRGFADTRLARFKVPSTIEFRDELPREASGKLKKRLLRDPYWE